MTPNNVFTQLVANGVATDTVGLNQGDGNVVHLAKNAFTPGPNLVYADLVEADFDGYAEKSSTTAPQEGIDPATNDHVVTIPPPAGGWRWETTGVTNLNQTIYGYYLSGQDSGNLWMAQRFATPIVLTGINQEIVIGTVNVRLVAGLIQ